MEQSKGWFTDIIWRHYEQYKAMQLKNAVGALRVDGEAGKEELFSHCLAYCEKMVAARFTVLHVPRAKVESAPKRVREDGKPKPDGQAWPWQAWEWKQEWQWDQWDWRHDKWHDWTDWRQPRQPSYPPPARLRVV